MLPINLAPFKYRDLIKVNNPIIKKISYRALPDIWHDKTNSLFEAYAYLNDSHHPHWLQQSILYGNADGTGTSKYKNQACYKAVSEALERWCFFETMHSTHANKFGFIEEPTTLGLAAFPGLGHSYVRNLALQEAIERWSICAWWEGVLPTRSLTLNHNALNACIIIHPWKQEWTSNLEVVLLWTSEVLGQKNITAYGFACGNSTNEAMYHAHNELRRNIDALSNHQKFLINTQVETPKKIEEKRLQFFSTETGFSLFTKKMQAAKLLSAPLVSAPELLVDQAISGPWSQYTKVWRCLFAMPSQKHLEPMNDFFLF